MLAPKMGCGQAAAFAQEIRQGLTRLDLVADLGAVQFKRD
jgi:hypothetical protein